MNNLIQWFFRPVDNTPLILFRVCFGIILALEGFGAIISGWVKETFIDPQIHFPFIGFEWLQPIPGYGMYFYYAILGIAGVMVAIGYRYHLFMALFSILWLGCYLMQKIHYNNHYYLLVLLSFIMVFLPANTWFSIDVKKNPAIRSHTSPYWTHFILIAQLAIVYFFAAIAKIYPDWLAGRPLAIWFGAKQHYFLLGPLFTDDTFISIIKYGGILFDLLVIPFLLYKPTRWIAIIASFIFHLFNSIVFQIGTFPYLMLVFLLFFVETEWLRGKVFKNKPGLENSSIADVSVQKIKGRRLIMGLVILYLIIQIVLPLRHWLYNGNVHWTEEGHRLSWHMMLRSKRGSFYCKVKADSVDSFVIPNQYLTPVQIHSMATRPDMLWQFAKFLGTHYELKGYKDVNVYVHSRIQLNGHQEQLLIDPEVALNKESWNIFLPSPWILPFRPDE